MYKRISLQNICIPKYKQLSYRAKRMNTESAQIVFWMEKVDHLNILTALLVEQNEKLEKLLTLEQTKNSKMIEIILRQQTELKETQEQLKNAEKETQDLLQFHTE